MSKNLPADFPAGTKVRFKPGPSSPEIGGEIVRYEGHWAIVKGDDGKERKKNLGQVTRV